MSLFSGLISKVAGSAVGGFLQSYGVWILGGIMATFIAWYVWSAEGAKKEVVRLDLLNTSLVKQVNELLGTIQQNQVAMDECIEANARNALEAVREGHRVLAAQADVAAMRRELLAHMDQDRTHTEELRGQDKECRSADDVLPEWLVSGLRDDA